MNLSLSSNVPSRTSAPVVESGCVAVLVCSERNHSDQGKDSPAPQAEALDLSLSASE